MGSTSLPVQWSSGSSGSLSITAGHSVKPWSTCGSSVSCSPHGLRPLPFRTVPSRYRPNIPFSVTVNYPSLMISSSYVFYATQGVFVSRDFKVLVTDFALWARLPIRVSLVGSMVKNPPADAGEEGSIPGSERCPGQGNNHLVQFLPGESDGRRSLVGCSPWGHRESDTVWRVSRQLAIHGCLGDSEPSGQCLTPPGAGPVNTVPSSSPRKPCSFTGSLILLCRQN